MRQQVFGCLLLAAMFSAFGCEYAAKIEHPTQGKYDDPVTEFRVKFHKDFKPGTFKASLEGQPITQLFQPTAAPGSFSFAAAPSMDLENSPQLLRVEGEFTFAKPPGLGKWLELNQEEFTPPYTMVYRGPNTYSTDLSLKERETIVATAFVEKPPPEALTVTIPGNPAVSLNEQPAGQAITVVIQRNERRADFNIRGIVVGRRFELRARAPGYAAGLGAGIVKSPSP